MQSVPVRLHREEFLREGGGDDDGDDDGGREAGRCSFGWLVEVYR